MKPLVEESQVELQLSEQNPWPGPASFPEDSAAFFKGREREIEELTRQIRREVLSVVFGKSGTGKSSLLKAGLFPNLRETGFVPIYIRLRHDEVEPALLDQVKDKIREAILDKDYPIRALPPEPQISLWEYFHLRDNEWWDKRVRLVTPILVFDQFEEMLTLGRDTQERVDRSEAFLSELEDLIEGRVPERLQSKRDDDPRWKQYFDEHYDLTKKEFRVILTLREDFLAELESLRERFRAITWNRYRLLPMTGEQALDAILQPAPHLVDEATALQIIQRLSISEKSLLQAIPTREQVKGRQVEPSLLSSFCYELNLRRKRNGREKIDASLLAGAREEILANFYERAFTGLKPEVRDFVEDDLLTVTGARNRCALANALNRPGITEDELRTLINRRLVRQEKTGENVWLELTHDILADIARASKRSRDDRRRTTEAEKKAAIAQKTAERRNKQRFLALAAAAACLALAIFAGYSYRQAQRAYDKIKSLTKGIVSLEADIAPLRKERESLQNERQSLQREKESLQNLLSDKSVQVQRSQVSLLGSKADVILAILRNQLPSALAKCDVALQSLDEQTDQSQTRGEFLQLRGDILTQQALLVWDTDGALTQPNAPNIKAETDKVQQLLEKAKSCYEDAQRLFANQSIEADENRIRIASVYRWMSFNSEDKSSSADFRAKAEALLANIREGLAKEELYRTDSRALLALEADSMRLSGNLIYDGFKKQGVRNIQASDLDQAILLYKQATNVGQRLLGETRSGLEQTFVLGSQIFALANLADCYRFKLTKLAGTGNNVETGTFKSALKRTLDERITLCKKLLSMDRTNRYFATLLGFGYFNLAKCGFEDKIVGLAEEEAYRDLQFAFCLTVMDPPDDITNYLWNQVKTRRGAETANRIKELADEFKRLNAELDSTAAIDEKSSYSSDLSGKANTP